MSSEQQHLNKRQDLILDYIAENSDALSVADVLGFIGERGEDVSRITVVRDLALLTDEGFLMREGAGRGVRYRISPMFDLHQTIDIESYFAAPQDERTIRRTFNFDVFTLLVDGVFAKSEGKHLASLHKQFRSKIERMQSETLIKKEYERIAIEFSWKSSSIEGNTYSLLDTEALIKNHQRAKGKLEEEALMILNHKSAFTFVSEQSEQFQHLSWGDIEDVHALLVEGLGVTKNLRESPVAITGTNYRPLDDRYRIKDAASAMIWLINKKDNFFEKSLLCLVLLSYIQAFEDGNKRTARMVANAVLFANKSTPMSYRAVDEAEYKKATILFYEQNNIVYFKQVFMEQFEFAVKNYFH